MIECANDFLEKFSGLNPFDTYQASEKQNKSFHIICTYIYSHNNDVNPTVLVNEQNTKR